MKFTFTIFIGITLSFVAISFVAIGFAQQPTSTFYQPKNNETLQVLPMQTPPKNITSNGVVIYQNQPTQLTQPVQGFNSPFPTNLAPPSEPNHNLNPNQPSYPTQPSHSTQPSYPSSQPSSNQFQPRINQPNPYQPNTADNRLPPNRINNNSNNNSNGNSNNNGNNNSNSNGNGNGNINVNGNKVTTNGSNNGIVRVADNSTGRFVGHSSPAVRVHPFILNPEEQRDLDDFLLRWEKYSETINNYEIDFNAFFYDPTNPLSPPVTSSEPQLKPLKIMFGYFKFVAPKKFVYHVEGEWIQKERIRYIDQEATPNILAEKTIIDGQTLFFYDFTAKKVTQYRMTSEELNRTIGNGPFPLIFGAKAGDMKKRFSMKIVTNPDYRDKEVWLWAVPLLPDDQKEFVKIEIRLDKRTLNAMALKRIDPNEKSYTTYTLHNPKINNRFLPISDIFKPDIPRGWKHEIQDQLQSNMNPNMNPNVNPNMNPNMNPTPFSSTLNKSPNAVTQPRQEINLYKP
ncbi:MAG: hypothetical protein LBE18_11835 [Planctomycetaceae bacterium]|jgi:outer membrane lipoprotein-sorting protein|nr:hypothetical protein [Planctomycetaceae bacterium]